MLAVILGVLFILLGVGWFLLAGYAAGMASRQTTGWESMGRPLMGLILVALGVTILIWG